VAGLQSKGVALNGKELRVVTSSGAAGGVGGAGGQGGGEPARDQAAPALPSMPPVARTGEAIVLPPLTFGFFVLPAAGAAACV
jgi:hypothetical protein